MRLTIEKVSFSKLVMTIAVSGATILLLSACRTHVEPNTLKPTPAVIIADKQESTSAYKPAAFVAPDVEEEVATIVEETPKWSQEEIDAIALTLAGECYDDKENDKRLVCEVILNRVSNGSFGTSIITVLSAENQFEGYWTQSRPVTANDYEVAEQALEDWYNNECKALSKYLFFCAGNNRENTFREEF